MHPELRSGREAEVIQSHTILGSKSQRGMTQLSLDVLFQSIQSRIVDASEDDNTLQSLAVSDVSEAQIMTASTFLELTYGDGTAATRMSRATSRAATPMMVGSFPLDVARSSIRQTRARAAQAQQKTRNQGHPSIQHVSWKKSPHPHFPFSLSFRTVTKEAQKDVSLVSIPGANSRKHMPRLSTLPQYPSVESVQVDCDTSSQYAIVISMYEVYNDRIFDLLVSSSAKSVSQKRRGLLFKSTELSPDRKVVAGLRKIICANIDEALLVLETGLVERTVAGTGSNAVSSRSHGFFCVEVKKRPERSTSCTWKSSSFTIVDLAGMHLTQLVLTVRRVIDTFRFRTSTFSQDYRLYSRRSWQDQRVAHVSGPVHATAVGQLGS